jgi:hypothetical protein
MTLQGSLETVGLPDVLSLLGRAAKTGRLAINGPKRTGGIWFGDGQITAIDTGSAVESAYPVDALFELLRLESGTFAFDETAAPPEHPAPVAVGDTVAAASARLVEWRSIEAVVGSLDATVELVAETAGPVTLTPEQWATVIAIHGASRVGDVLERQGLGEFDGCNLVRSLVVAGFARIKVSAEAPVAVVTVPMPDVPLVVGGLLAPTDAPGRAGPPSSPLWPSVALLSEPTSPVELDAEAGAATAGQEEGVSDDPAMSGDGDAAEPMNRGLLLKFLSSVRS